MLNRQSQSVAKLVKLEAKHEQQKAHNENEWQIQMYEKEQKRQSATEKVVQQSLEVERQRQMKE